MSRRDSVPLARRLTALIVTVSLLGAPGLRANPQGGAVRHGQVRIHSSAGHLQIRQFSDRAVIDWNSFSIGRGEVTRFIQPGADSAVLNRVRGDSASQIEGLLRANGRVFLLNPNGILIGPEGTIDVGGFVASTLDTGDRRFLRGGNLHFRGGSEAAVVNLGSISAFDGDVVLMGASVLNEGTIRARKGLAALAAGNDILLAESGSERVFVRGSGGPAKAAGVTNTGSIEANVAELKAHGGNIYGLAVRNDGRVAATGVSREGGQIFLRAGGGKVQSTGTLQAKKKNGNGGRITVDAGRGASRTEVGGVIDASSMTGAGGEIVVLGDEIEVAGGTLILNDGATAGGTTRIGGGLRGTDPRFANATSVTIGNGAVLSANATGLGNGGTVVVFAEGSLVFDGSVSARGGAFGGNGGFVELSGKESVQIANFAGRIDLAAPHGAAGTFLYDPIDIVILGGSNSAIPGSPVSQNTLYADDISAFLATANLVITTSSPGGDLGNITLDGGAPITWSAPTTLSLYADNDLNLGSGSLIAAGGGGRVVAEAAGVLRLHGTLAADGGLQLIADSIDIGGSATIDSGASSTTITPHSNGLSISLGAPDSSVALGLTNAELGRIQAGLIEIGNASSGPINLTSDLTMGNSLSLVSGGPVTVSASVEMAPDRDFSINTLGSNGSITLNGGNAKITTSGTGTLTLHAVRNIAMTAGSYLGADTGAIVLAANASGNGTGAFSGITLDAASIVSSGGPIFLTGYGGDSSTSAGQEGVSLRNDSQVSTGGSGGIQITGVGGTGTNHNVGVHISSSTVTTATGTLTLSGAAADSSGSGNHGLVVDYASELTTQGGNMGLSGTSIGGYGARFADNSSAQSNGGNLTVDGVTNADGQAGISLALSQVLAGGGTLQLNGDGAYLATAIESTDIVAALGNTNDTVILRSLGGQVNLSGRVLAGDLQLLDHGGLGNVAFTLGNANNDVERIAASSNGSTGGVGSLHFQDRDGFTVASFGGSNGITASGDVTLVSDAPGSAPIVIAANVISHGGHLTVDGFDLVVEGADLATVGLGSITLEASRAILIRGGAQLSVVDGNLSLEANTADTAEPGLFTGITILGSTLQSSGEGYLSLTGKGGGGGGPDFSYPGFVNPGSNGIRLDGGAVLATTSTSPDAGGILLDGVGGAGVSDSHGLSLHNSTISTQSGPIHLSGTGGGQSGGTGNTGILANGTLIRTGGTGDLDLSGLGGAGSGNGIELGSSTTLAVGDGGLSLQGTGASQAGIGVFATALSGDIRVEGIGSLEVQGEGSGGSAGVHLGGASLLGGASALSVNVFSEQGDLQIDRAILATGNIDIWAYPDDVTLGGSAQTSQGDITINGFNLTIGAPLTATLGDVTLVFGDQTYSIIGGGGGGGSLVGGFSIGIMAAIPDGVAAVNAPVTAGGQVQYRGGSGAGDILTFAGWTPSSSGAHLAFDQLTLVENVVGSSSGLDELLGPSQASVFNFQGQDLFTVGGVSFLDFENVTGGANNDIFIFLGSATLGGILDGGGGSDVLDYSGYGSGVHLNAGGAAATGIGGGLNGIETIRGSAYVDTFTGPANSSVYQITGPDAFSVGAMDLTGFENLVGGDLADRFVFLPGAGLSGYLDGGLSTQDILDYSSFGQSVRIDLRPVPRGSATGVAGGINGIENFVGSANVDDRFTGPHDPTTYRVDGLDSFTTATFAASGFENLTGGAGRDRFEIGRNGKLRGSLSGGGGGDILSYANFDRPVVVEIGPNRATGIADGFSDIETILGSKANDLFRFLDQSTISYVDGGGGRDRLELDDRDLGGEHTYTVSQNRISRNPTYRFGRFETVELRLGPGNNTVNSSATSYRLVVRGGPGYDTINHPSVGSVDQDNGVGNVLHYEFEAPRPTPANPGFDPGELLQREIDRPRQLDPRLERDFDTENRFNILDPATFSVGSLGLTGGTIGFLGGAQAAAVVGQAIIISAEGGDYLILRPFSLDGTGLTPSNLGLAALHESLGVPANLELAAAIGHPGPFFLIASDGPFALDLSGPPLDPAVIAELQQGLSLPAALELSNALGLNIALILLPGDGPLSLGLDAAVPGPDATLRLAGQLDDAALADLNAAIGAAN